MNIIGEIDSLLSDQLIRQVSNDLGESESGVGKVIGALAPTILAGILNKSKDNSGFEQIFDMLSNQKNVDYLDNLGDLVGGGNLAQGNPRDAAGSLLGSLFGDKVGSIIDVVTNMGEVNKGSSSSLLGLVGPMIMGYLGKKITNGGLNSIGLINLLSLQRRNISAALPAELADLIGFSQSPLETPRVASVDRPEPVAASGGNNLLKYLLPALLLLGAFFAWRSCGDDVKKAGDDAVEEATDVATDRPEASKDMANAASDTLSDLGDFMKRELPGGISLSVPENGIESQLITFITDDAKKEDKETWLNFDRLNFRTGSAELDIEKSQEQLDNIAQVLQAYPNVELKIGGYTDNTGSEQTNMTLSQNRANTVMQNLVEGGIGQGRLDAEGYGPAHPVASNDTEEGRAQNRRIAVRVTKK